VESRARVRATHSRDALARLAIDDDDDDGRVGHDRSCGRDSSTSQDSRLKTQHSIDLRPRVMVTPDPSSSLDSFEIDRSTY
jgi:hypothetical protein